LAFVVLGVVLRFVRYAMKYPLWWDESFLAVNLIKRGYLDLLRPLDYSQVCPILFLWAELTVVRLLGFYEWTLRLFPLVCGIASVLLFRHVAGRIVRGLPLLLAVAIFAVSYHPIRHAADAKPYASDLLAALLVMAAAIECTRTPSHARWMWTLAALSPVLIALSHPAIFVVSGVALALAPAVIKARSRRVVIAYLALVTSTVGTFLLLYALFTRSQAAATLAIMQRQWVAAFPPIHEAGAFCRWFVTAHTGSMFAYPCGGERGLSSLTVALFSIGAALLWFQRRRAVLLLCTAPFVMGLCAAALKRYPYGGVADGSPARVMQYLVPSICLLTGIGAATTVGVFRNPARRARAVRIGLLALAVIGISPLVTESFHPYRSIHAYRARELARRFWPELERGAEPLCLRWDLGIGKWNSSNLNTAVYLCNQLIYSQHRRSIGRPDLGLVSADHPLRCVDPFPDSKDARRSEWLPAMEKKFHLVQRRDIVVDMSVSASVPRTERYAIYEFVPIELGAREASLKAVR
jgi:hypothetical protein